MHTVSTPSYRTISRHDFAEVRRNSENGQNALFSLRSFQPGEIIADFSAGTIAPEPTYLTVQVGTGKHITLQPEFLQYINHSCDPNVFFDTTAMKLVALKELDPETELVFFYPSTEWRMTQSFECYCGAPCCLGTIQGADYLSPDSVAQYRFTDYIQQELAGKADKSKVA